MADISLTDAEHVLQDIVNTAGEISAAIQTVIEGKPERLPLPGERPTAA